MPSIGTVDKHGAHGIDGGPVGAVLVAAADPARCGERCRLGDSHQFECQVAVRLLGRLIRGHRPSTVARGDGGRAKPRWITS